MLAHRTVLLIIYLILLVPTVVVLNQLLPQPQPNTMENLLVAVIKGLAVFLLSIRRNGFDFAQLSARLV